jgi:hypothetical protein
MKILYMCFVLYVVVLGGIHLEFSMKLVMLVFKKILGSAVDQVGAANTKFTKSGVLRNSQTIEGLQLL